MEQQESLFEEGRQRDELVSLRAQISDKSNELRDKLKACAGFMALLKDGPKTVVDIFFRCQQSKLAGDTLTLLSDQARELSELFLKAGSMARLITDFENKAATISASLPEGRQESTTDVSFIDETEGDEDESNELSDLVFPEQTEEVREELSEGELI